MAPTFGGSKGSSLCVPTCSVYIAAIELTEVLAQDGSSSPPASSIMEEEPIFDDGADCTMGASEVPV
eukprot:6043585-Amphidinium_carterae.1